MWKYQIIEGSIRKVMPSSEIKKVITKQNFKRFKQEFEDAVLRVWKTSKIVVPKMLLDFRVSFQEVYASTIGKILVFTPFWRGRAFTDAILMHEFLHWALFPIDLQRALRLLFSARRMLAKDLKFVPKLKETDLYGTLEDWKNFPYTVREIAFCQNLLGDYLINLFIHNYHPKLFKTLWKFLYHHGTFYEKQKQLKRDTSFLLYLSVYSELIPELEGVGLFDTKTEKDRDKIAEIIKEVKKKKMSKAWALKELVKIFHPYLKQDAKDATGKGEGSNGESKCPKCGHKEFEVVGYQNPKTKKWVNV